MSGGGGGYTLTETTGAFAGIWRAFSTMWVRLAAFSR